MTAPAMRRIEQWTTLLVVLGAAGASLRSNWHGEAAIHTLLDTTAAVTAAVVGAMGLVRYYARREPTFLLIGVGFLATAALESTHALLTSVWIDLQSSTLVALAPWSWYAPRVMLATMMLLALVTDLDDSERVERIRAGRVYLLVTAIILSVAVLFTLVPLPTGYFLDLPVRRPQEILPALLFAIVAFLCLRDGRWRDDTFTHWFVLSALVGLVAQLLIAGSAELYDAPFDTAHVLKIISYLLVFVGFLFGFHELHAQMNDDVERHDRGRRAAEVARAAESQRAGELERSERRLRHLFETAAVSLWELDLSDLEARLRQLVPSSDDLERTLAEDPELVDDLSRSLTWVAVNPASLSLFGASDMDEFLASFRTTMTPRAMEVFAGLAVALAEGRASYRAESQHRTLQGETVHVALKARWYESEEGRTRCVVSLSDITEIRRSTEALQLRTAELEVLSEELARSNAELDDFAYIASHDLREPLRGIANFSNFLLQDHGERLGPEGREQVNTLLRISERMDGLILSLLEYSRVSRSDPAAVEPVDLAAVVSEVLDSIPSLADRNVELVVASDLPTARMDRGLATRLFHNLVTNALKYNDSEVPSIEVGVMAGQPAPRVPVAAGAHSPWQGGADVADELQGGAASHAAPVLFVRDNGIGIREKHLGSIFKIFKRLHGRDRYGGGAGAGLTIVKKIVESVGGRIWVESTFGEGTTFYFTLEPEAP